MAALLDPSSSTADNALKRPRDPPATLYCACLGRLGQFGNQIFQFAFATLCARVHRLNLITPDWIGRYCFPYAAAFATAPPASRVLVADRVVLSHAGWRAWASQRAPLSSFGELSGKRLRAEMPQVNASSLSTGALCCAGAQHVPPGGCLELWGWFQFGTADYAPHRAAVADAFVLAPALQALVDSALAIVLDGAETLVCVHVRCSDDYAALADGRVRARRRRRRRRSRLAAAAGRRRRGGGGAICRPSGATMASSGRRRSSGTARGCASCGRSCARRASSSAPTTPAARWAAASPSLRRRSSRRW